MNLLDKILTHKIWLTALIIFIGFYFFNTKTDRIMFFICTFCTLMIIWAFIDLSKEN